MEDIPFQHCDLGCCAGDAFNLYDRVLGESDRLIITLRSWNKMGVQVAWKNNFYVGRIDQQLSHRCKRTKEEKDRTLFRGKHGGLCLSYSKNRLKGIELTSFV